MVFWFSRETAGEAADGRFWTSSSALLSDSWQGRHLKSSQVPIPGGPGPASEMPQANVGQMTGIWPMQTTEIFQPASGEKSPCLLSSALPVGELDEKRGWIDAAGCTRLNLSNPARDTSDQSRQVNLFCGQATSALPAGQVFCFTRTLACLCRLRCNSRNISKGDGE